MSADIKIDLGARLAEVLLRERLIIPRHIFRAVSC
jgi:hypothetical protein